METRRAAKKRLRSTLIGCFNGEDEQEAQERVQIPTPFVRRSNCNANTKSSSEGDHTAIILQLQDREILDCDICFEPLKAPLFQCENGHIICSSCSSCIKDKCPTCQSPFSSKRCRAMEKILESVRAYCGNLKYGCTESFIYSEKSGHERKCRYAPCSCPFPGCAYRNSAKLLYKHWSTEHKSLNYCFSFGTNVVMALEIADKYFVLQEREEGILFMVNTRPVHKGCMVSVSCITSPNAGIGEFSYMLSVEAGNRGPNLRLESKATAVQSSGDDLFSECFLMVPYQFFRCSSGMKVNMVVRIERHGMADN